MRHLIFCVFYISNFTVNVLHTNKSEVITSASYIKVEMDFLLQRNQHNFYIQFFFNFFRCCIQSNFSFCTTFYIFSKSRIEIIFLVLTTVSFPKCKYNFLSFPYYFSIFYFKKFSSPEGIKFFFFG